MLMRTLLLAFITSLVMVAPPANGASPDPVRAAIAAGADRLVALQNADGGWFFTVGDVNCGAGPGVSCPNTFGVTALGLVEAYGVTHSASHLAAAKKAADALVAKHNTAPPCDGNPGTGADRPFTVDADFPLQGNATIRDARNRWKADLLATQNANGSWTDDTQNTAYIVMGLTKTSQGGGTKAAIDAAVAFLLAQQQPNGGFLVDVGSTDEVTEVDSEVLQALVAK